MKHKGFLIAAVSAMAGSAVVLSGCEWRPFGRDYFVTSGDGKAGSSYGEPWINSNTYGTVNKDTTHDGENGDIYLSANYDNIIATELKDGESSAGVQEEASKQVSSSLLEMMKTKGTSPESSQVNTLYELYTDTESRKNAWTETILPQIKSLQDVQDLSGLSAYLCSDAYFDNGENIVSFDYDLDYNDPSIYSFVIIPTSLSLGDSAEYSNKSEYGEKTEDIFTKQASLLLKKAGYSDDGAKTIIQNALMFEKDIASHMKPQEFRYSSEYISSVNNPADIAQLKAEQGNFPLSGIMEAYGIDKSEHIYLIEPEWLAGMKEIYTEENFENIKSYVLIKTLQGYADSADEETYIGIRDIYNEANDIKEGSTLEDYAFSYVKGLLPGTLGKMYIESQIDPEDKNEAEKLVNDILDKYKIRVNEITFLSENTRSEALKKLENMKVHVAYTDTSPAASAADIKSKEEGGTLVEAVVAVRKADREYKLSHLNRAVSDSDLDGDITEVSVKYFGLGNILVVNAGALKGYFSSEMTREEQLGGLGSLVAKTIAGAVLKTGSEYDADGKYSPYWSDSDIKAYEDHYKNLKEELNSIKPFKDDTKLDGTRVLDSVVNEIFGFKVLNDIASDNNIDKEKLSKAFALSRFTVMREDTMEKTGLNSSEALPYITVNTTIKHNSEDM